MKDLVICGAIVFFFVILLAFDQRRML